MMKRIFILLLILTTLLGCSGLKTKDINKLNKTIDFNKSIISNGKAEIFKHQAESFKNQRSKDLEIISGYCVLESLKKELFEKWDMLIKETEKIYQQKLLGTLQTHKLKVLIEDIEVLKSQINKEIEVISKCQEKQFIIMD